MLVTFRPAGLMLILFAAIGLAQDSRDPAGNKDDKEQIEAALKLTRVAAGKYRFEVGGEDAPATKLLPEPVLRWSNPNVGEIHGNVFLWTQNSRPVAIGSLFKWFSPHKHTSHEFQSLSESSLAASYDGKKVWATKAAGVKFTPLDKVEPPAETAARRLVQMRQIMKRFRGDETTREGEDYELRLLPQPIYRYEAAKDDVIDGGMFAHVQGTDPEIIVLLEARPGPDKKPRWEFAAGRMQNIVLRLKFDDREVWSVPQLEWSVAFDHGQPYTLFDTPGK
jgi:hypothetical protein